MTLQEHCFERIAAELEKAEKAARAIEPLGLSEPGIDETKAYAIQQKWDLMRIADGRVPVGYKVGMTSVAAQASVGLARPLHGRLFADMQIAEGGTVDLSRYLAPRVEMELCFLIGRSLAADCTREEALAAIEWAAPAVEMIDNRIAAQSIDGKVRRTGIDMAADGGAAAGYLVSQRTFDPRTVELASLSATLRRRGEVVDQGNFTSIFGSPEIALVELSRDLARFGRALEPGEIVLCGSVIKPFAVAPGDRLEFDFGSLGIISACFE